MKKLATLLSTCLLNFALLFSNEPAAVDTNAQPNRKVVIVGGGIIGAMESYYAHVDAVKSGKKVQVVIYEKGPAFNQNPVTNTAYNIFPSLTADEILSVVPRGQELIDKLAIVFSDPGGIRVDDASGVNDSSSAVEFKKAVTQYGKDQKHDDRTKNLLMLGKMSMDMWQDLYDHADAELKQILVDSNFNPCHDPKNKNKRALHDGYRIDIIYDVANAEGRAKGMQETYTELGYTQCKILSPKEVMTLDPSLTEFCKQHSTIANTRHLTWKSDCSALWRPGGCIATRIFLPRFYNYLKKVMGTYVDTAGQTRDCFAIEFNKDAVAVDLDNSSETKVVAVKFADGTSEQSSAQTETSFVFCPGEAVGTLHQLGFEEPAYAGFAGPSLCLNIPVSAEQAKKYRGFSHCMEVHKVGIVLAWQARFKDDKLIIGVAGTKAFYGDQLPTNSQAFAKNRHLVQLNMINDVLPEMVSIAFGKNTQGLQLTQEDLAFLENKGVAKRWVGRRAVAYDGFPTLGALYANGRKVANARCTTHLGSGGVSFAPAAVKMSRSSASPAKDGFTSAILHYADSRRQPEAL